MSKYYRACMVCGRWDQNHLIQMHYGAFSCFSCKSFFKRIHGKSHQTPHHLLCSGEGEVEDECPIYPDGKKQRNCRKCRYRKCIEVGMKPLSVLNSDQIKKRFRKSLKKKMELIARGEKPKPRAKRKADSDPISCQQPPKRPRSVESSASSSDRTSPPQLVLSPFIVEADLLRSHFENVIKKLHFGNNFSQDMDLLHHSE